MRILCLSALLCPLLSGPALAQQPLPGCEATKEIGEWRVTAWPDHGLVVFPRNNAWPRDRDAFGDSVSMPDGHTYGMLTAYSPQTPGTVKDLPARGVATARFGSLSEKVDLTGIFFFKSYSAGEPAKRFPAVDVVEFSFALQPAAH